MRTFFIIFLAAMFGTGCYTQVKSSGDYWGYTGHHEREKVALGLIGPVRAIASFLQFGVAFLNLGEHFIERIDERADLVMGLPEGANGIILFL